MISYICPRCHHTTHKKSSILNHLKNMKMCPCTFADESRESIIERLITQVPPSETCPHCFRVFTSAQYLQFHQKKCLLTISAQQIEVHNKQQQQLSTLNSQLRKEMEGQMKDIKELKERTKRRKNLSAASRMTLWNESFGEKSATGQCYCCDREVTWQGFEAGHVISVAGGGSDNISNLKVVCKICNLSMGTNNMMDFRMKYFSR